MTRKRFEKKMMAAGVSRNDARVLARRRPLLSTYDQWFSYCHLCIVCGAFGKACRRAGFALRNLLLAVAFDCGEVPRDE